MAFGVKIKKMELKNTYTLESLYEAMKAKTWEAGEPQYVKHGLAYVICFPPVDRQNQVWVQLTKKETNKVQVFLSHDLAGDFGNMAKNAILDKVTGGFAGMGAAFGKKAKAGEAAVDSTIKEFETYGL